MSGFSRILLATIGILVLAARATPARADDDDVVEYRQHIMKSMGEQVGAIGQILTQKIVPDNFAAHLQILAIVASTAKTAFTPKVAGGNAKPDVWANWPDFSKRLDDLIASTAELAKLAKNGGVTAAAPKLRSLPCMECHDVYRTEKK
jgi:cytochrome c556